MNSVRELRARLGFGSLSTGSSASSVSSAADTHRAAPDADGLAMPRRAVYSSDADSERRRSHSVGPLLDPSAPVSPAAPGAAAPPAFTTAAAAHRNHKCALSPDASRRFSMQNLDLVHLNPTVSLIKNHLLYMHLGCASGFNYCITVLVQFWHMQNLNPTSKPPLPLGL